MSNMSYRGFKDFLSYKFGTEWDLMEIAGRMHMPHSTLAKYLYEERYFPVDLLAPLYNATKDRTVLNFILRNTDDLTLATRQEALSGKPIINETLDVHAAMGGFSQALQAFLSGDNEIDAGEAKKLLPLIEGVEKEVGEVKQRLLKTINTGFGV